MRADYHHVAVALRRADSVVVCAHVRPDGDAVGSVLGLTLALRSVGVPAIPTLANADRGAPATYSWLPGFALYAPAADLAPPTVFVALDTPNLERLEAARPLAEKAGTLVVLDHHPDATEYGDVHVLDASVAATGELVWGLLEALGVTPSPEIATCCYTALMTDTGRFAFQNTTASALRTAADMVSAGAAPAEVARNVYQNRSAASLALEARTMTGLTVANGGQVAYVLLGDSDFEETGAVAEEAEHLPEAIRVLGGVEVVALLRQKGTEVRGNLRAKGGFDVGSVARGLGGGGHAAAAGFTVADANADDVLARLLPQLPGGARS